MLRRQCVLFRTGGRIRGPRKAVKHLSQTGNHALEFFNVSDGLSRSHDQSAPYSAYGLSDPQRGGPTMAHLGQMICLLPLDLE